MRLMVLFAVAFSCAAQTPAPPAPRPDPAQPAAARPREDGLYATLKTTLGDITFRFFEKEAPATTRNFVDLALGRKTYTDPATDLPSRKPFYDGLTFHRVIPEFMIQGGDPLANGTGGTEPIPDEFVPSLRFEDAPGRVAMANSGPGTSSCQFFITINPAQSKHLNQLHTIFGQVVEGMAVVEKISGVNTREDKPVVPVVIEKVIIERVGPEPR